MNFIIEMKDGVPAFDFGYTTLELIKRQNWWDRYQTHTVNGDDPGVPVGSVEFVQNYYGIQIKPINIPECLNRREFLRRRVYYSFFSDIEHFPAFVKSADKLKVDPKICRSIDDYGSNEYCMISDVIDNIQAEYRFFIYDNTVVGCKHYDGDWKVHPSYDLVNQMVASYKNAPKAYTLDIMVQENGATSLIEIHDFFSCGLYGFSDKVILDMLIACNKRILQINDKKGL